MEERQSKSRKYKWFIVFASFWIPLIGLFMFFANRKENPKDANTYGLAAIVGFAINFYLLSR